jgi:hypothetical protein
MALNNIVWDAAGIVVYSTIFLVSGILCWI